MGSDVHLAPEEQKHRNLDTNADVNRATPDVEVRRLLELSIRYDQQLSEILQSRRWKFATTLARLAARVPTPLRKRITALLRRIWQSGVDKRVVAADPIARAAAELREELYGFLYPQPPSSNAEADEAPPGGEADAALALMAGPALGSDAVHPPVSIVSPLYKSAHALPAFLDAAFAQDYGGTIEIILIDDNAADNGPAIAARYASDHPHPARQLRVVSTEQNLGNCGARNLGIGSATGDIIIIVDPDCILNASFVRAHVEHHRRGVDVVIGPMGLECRQADLGTFLQQLERGGRPAMAAQMRMQDQLHLASAVNCVTRNFSIRRAMLELLATPLFDERFSYRNAADTGFGWEDVEMGARLFKAGASIAFEWTAFSVHMQHPSTISAAAKAQGLARNFDLLLSTHPELIAWHPAWAAETLARIVKMQRDNGVAAPDLGRWQAQLPTVPAMPAGTTGIALYSAIAGPYDDFTPSPAGGQRQMTLFTDLPERYGMGPTLRPFDAIAADPVRTAKKPKIMPHLYFPDAEWSVWIDGNVTLQADPAQLVDEVWRAGCLFGSFRHPQRNCIYDEAVSCIQRRKDSADVIIPHVGRLQDAGFPRHVGLIECNVIVRRHNHPAVRAVMEDWWQEIARGSRRDQLSLNYVLWKAGLAYHELGNGAVSVRTDRRFQYRLHANQL